MPLRYLTGGRSEGGHCVHGKASRDVGVVHSGSSRSAVLQVSLHKKDFTARRRTIVGMSVAHGGA